MIRANARIDQRHNWDSVWCVVFALSARECALAPHARNGTQLSALSYPLPATPRPSLRPPPPPRVRRWEWPLNLRGILYYSIPRDHGHTEMVYLLGE
jgi:hypothetical protein